MWGESSQRAASSRRGPGSTPPLWLDMAASYGLDTSFRYLQLHSPVGIMVCSGSQFWKPECIYNWLKESLSMKTVIYLISLAGLQLISGFASGILFWIWSLVWLNRKLCCLLLLSKVGPVPLREPRNQKHRVQTLLTALSTRTCLERPGTGQCSSKTCEGPIWNLEYCQLLSLGKVL